MNFLKIMFTIFLLISITGLAAGETYKVVASGGHSDQDNINDALKKAKDNPGSTVYLSSENGPFIIDDSIEIGSNTVLTGDENTKIEIWEGSGQWFVIYKGMIIGDSFIFPPDNYVIHDIYLNGNCHKFPMSFADFVFPGGSGTHNSMWGINIRGYSTLGIGYMKNISIYNVTVENTFCDGIRLAYAENVYIHDNTLINCQHEGIYFVSVINFIVEDNYIDGVISDCIRIDNGVNGIIRNNYLGSYDGDKIPDSYKFGHQGIQIGNQGRSFNSGSTQPTDTNNIEVRGNIFEGKKRMNIWLHEGDNVYIHDNEFRDGEALETSGTPVHVDLGDFSYREEGEHNRRVPAVKTKNASIFDVLDLEFTDTGRTEQTADDIKLEVEKTTKGFVAGGVKIVGFKDRIILDGTYYIPDENSVLVKYKVIKSPDLDGWVGRIKQIDKNVDVEIKDGIAYATLTVKTSWYTIKENKLTGKKAKSKIKTSTVTFEDSSPSDKILERNTKSKAHVTVFADTKNKITKLTVDYTNATQKVTVNYEDNSTTHRLMIGERIKDENGVISTLYTRCDRWEGTIKHTGDVFILPGEFDKDKLYIEYFTPYESSEVDDIVVTYHKTEEENYNMIILKFIIYLILAMFAGYKMMSTIIN